MGPGKLRDGSASLGQCLERKSRNFPAPCGGVVRGRRSPHSATITARTGERDQLSFVEEALMWALGGGRAGQRQDHRRRESRIAVAELEPPAMEMDNGLHEAEAEAGAGNVVMAAAIELPG